MRQMWRLGWLTAALLGAASAATAAPITVAFCAATTNPAGESATCPTGFGAALQLNDELPGLDPADPNDFWLLLGVSSLAADGFDTVGTTGINGVQFDTPYKVEDYESVPSVLTPLVDGTGTWDAFFGSLNQCPSGNDQDKSVCSVVVGGGQTDTGDVDIWQFYVNLVDTIPYADAYTAATLTNMRVSFVPTGNLSPGGSTVPPNGGPFPPPPPPPPPPPEPVPEPSTMILLGTGLLAAARKWRRRT